LFYRFKSLEKMKKLVFMFVAVVAISFASCGNQAQAPVQDTDSIAEVVDSVVDSMAVDSVAADSVQ
jgi:predicted small secreted protein